MPVVNAILRFVVVFVGCLLLLSLLARMMDDSDTRWTTGAAVWGGALALAATDAWSRYGRRRVGRR